MKLLLGGSPCTHWSIAQTRNRETEPEGLGWELFRNYLIAKERYQPDFYLYENNKSMATAIRAQITAELGVEPILINSARVSAQSRQRLYWTNIPGVEQPEDRGIVLRDILESGVPLRDKGYTLDANYYKGGAVPFEHQSGKRLTVAEPVNTATDNKVQCLRAAYCKDGVRNMAGNAIDRKTCAAQPVCVNSKSGRGGVPSLQPSLADRIYSIEGKGTTVTAAFHPNIAVPISPIRVGNIESNACSDGQGNRVYSADGKGTTLCGNGGGAGAKTGLYTVPLDCSAGWVVGRRVNMDGNRDDYNPNMKHFPRSEANDLQKKHGITTVTKSNMIAAPAGMAWRGHARNENTASFEMRSDQKSNAVIVGHQSRLVIEAADGKAYPVYKVRNGQITIKGKRYPIRLEDGCYIIRKLTVLECMRLQTVPEDYIFPVSNTQAYKMLGNGWTVDVITHILSYCPGITAEPLEVLSMYDGMSCGRLALNKLRANIIRYCATEIDKYAIKTTQINFPDTVQLGDAFQVRGDSWWSSVEHGKGA
ncbi:MAG: hypothetical protein HFF09_07945 [Oscillospiraceae bacterium]|nr:hypothetical protein [Oscillospiraceae bacterium]